MKEYYVYILKCKDGRYYTGSTSDIEERLSQHHEGIADEGFTKNRRPLVLVYSQSFPDPYSMISAERQVKGWSRKKKEALIAGDFDILPALSECKNATHHQNKK